MIEMNEKVLGKNYSYFVNTLLFAFPIVINSVKVAGDLVLVILAIAGIFIAISHKVSPFSIRELKLFNWLTLFYFLVICISILFSGKASELAHFISRELYYLFAPFVALAIFKARVNISILLYGIKVGLILLAALVYFNTNTFDVRYSGSMNATAYGNIMGTMLLFSIAKISQENLTEKLFTLFAFFSGSLALIASGTRGAWIGVLITMFLYILIAYKKGELKSLLKFIGLTMLMAIVLVNFVKFPNMESRVLLAKQQVINWVSGKDNNSSVGVRMEMWSASIKQINQELPLTGFGYRNVNPVIVKHASKEAQSQIIRYNHVHNTYLQHLIAEGVLGLIAILALLLLPLRVFFVKIKDKKDNIVTASTMGVVLMVSFALFGVSNKMFGGVFINAFYVFFLAILLPFVYKKPS
jgi:O-antigen ligase